MDNKNAILTVPKLSSKAADRLERLLAQARQNIEPNVIIIVRETMP